MRALDLFNFNLQVIYRQPMRSAMLLVAIAIGVIAINLLTGLGEGGKRYVLGEFDFLGKNVLIILPGKKETTGGMPPVTGETPRDLTLEDAAALKRLPIVGDVAPLIAGNAQISRGAVNREAFTVGTNLAFFRIRQLRIASGKALPSLALDQAEAVCILGPTLRRELFGTQPALGEWVRAGERRFRVIGILQPEGQGLGFDMNEVMIIPVASAQALFNQQGLFRIFVELRSLDNLAGSRTTLTNLLRERHGGEEDVTLITQDSLMSAFAGVLNVMTLAVTGIAAISMLVAGILIMNVTLITVSQRTEEIGLLKALGAPDSTVRLIFLAEAGMMASCGAVFGLVISNILLFVARTLYPAIAFTTPAWAQIGSLLLALLTALLFALLPAQKAARMTPLDALQNKRAAQS